MEKCSVEAWEANLNPVILTAFMQGLTPTDTFKVFISLPGRPAGSDPNGAIGVSPSSAVKKIETSKYG